MLRLQEIRSYLLRDEHMSNELYIEILSSATSYVWFYTPYLMLGDALYDAFIRAAERGVDVRIIMPGIPDKQMIYRLYRMTIAGSMRWICTEKICRAVN